MAYFHLCALLSLLNSPFVIALLTVALGGLAVAALTSRYQRQQQIFQIRTQALRWLLEVQAKWIHAHLSGLEKDSHRCWTELLTVLRYVRVLFPSEEVGKKMKAYQDAGEELNRHSGLATTAQADKAKDEALAQFHRALNQLTRNLASRLGIPADGPTGISKSPE